MPISERGIRETSKLWTIVEAEMWIGDARYSARGWCDKRKKKKLKGDKLEVGIRGVTCFTADVTVTVAVWRRPKVAANRQLPTANQPPTANRQLPTANSPEVSRV